MSELRVPACANCGHAVWPPHLACARCGAGEWIEVPVSHGEVLDLTDTAGPDGDPIRLGTVRLDVGPPVIARCDGCEAGDQVELELVDGGLHARPKAGSKQSA